MFHILLFGFLSFQFNAFGDDKIVLDEDGFEIVSHSPSRESLDTINSKYIKNIKSIFSKKCLSCHGTNDSPPWYYSLPIAKQLMDSDMREAKKHMDMSNGFPFEGHGSPKDDLLALERTVRKNDMPPVEYKILHWDSELTEEEIKVINSWIIESLKVLENK